MGSRKKGFDDHGDIVSGLPDALICHILSFLPTKEAASTTVLAKRWKPLLAFVPNLEFDDSIYFHPRESTNNSESFMAFVDSVLALQETAPLKRFHVKCKDVVDDEYRVLDWIPKVLKRGVLDIDLHIPSRGFSSRSSFYPLPSEIFVSKTLVRLKIQFKDGVKIDVEGDVSLPKLKTLHLDYFKIDIKMFHKLLSGCHVLEELVVMNLMWADESLQPKTCFVTVSIPTLKRLTFHRFKDFDGDIDTDEAEDFNHSVALSFDNPNVVYLEYSDTIVSKYQQVSFDSLVEAKLKLTKTTENIDNHKINVPKLFMGICNVKILYLSYVTVQVLNCCHETMPLFENLIQLNIQTALLVGWKSLLPLLKNCPNLQTLVFQGLHHLYRNDICEDDDDWYLCQCQDEWWVKEDIDTCLSSSPVKVIKILKFGEICNDEHEDLDDQIEHVKQFLETMPDIEKMILYYNTPNDEDVREVSKQLKKLPRIASAKCEVQIISDSLKVSFTMSMKKGTLI